METAAAVEPGDPPRSSLADRLWSVRPHLSHELVDEAAFDRLLRVARHLPGDLMAALEIRLAPGEAPVDLSVRILEPRQAREIAPLLPPASSHVAEFLSGWAAGRWRPEPVHSVWLEFDLERAPGEGLPAPAVCARLRGAREGDLIKGDLLPRLHGRPLTTPQERLFCQAWDAIPECCSPLYVFSLAARGEGAVRLEIYGEDLGMVLEWLHRLDHPAAGGAVDTSLERAERFHVSCDVGPAGDFLPRAGLEASFRRLPHHEPRWAALLDELAARPGCDPGKRQALNAWPGQTQNADGACARVLSHVKRILAPGGGAEVKAYLLLEHVPRAVSAAARHQEALCAT